MTMKWEPKGYRSAKLVDENGRILGDVDYRTSLNEVVASLRSPFRSIGTYTAQAHAQAAVERAVASGPAPAAQPVAFHDKDQPNGIAWCPGYPEALKDITPLYAGERASDKRARGVKNQCDGCMQGAELRGNGLHYDRHGRVFMACQRERYVAEYMTPEGGKQHE